MIALLAALIVAGELFRRLPVGSTFLRLGSLAFRGRRTILRRASDRWEEKASTALSARMFTTSMLAAALLLLVLAPVVGVLLLDHLMNLGAMHALADWPSRLLIAIAILLYAVAKSQLKRLRNR